MIPRPINRLSDWLDRTMPVLILTPYLRGFGDCAENTYVGLLRARRENKKILFLFPWQLPFLKKAHLGVANKELLYLESPHRYLNANHFLCQFLGFVLGLIYSFSGVAYLIWRKMGWGINALYPQFEPAPYNIWFLMPSLGQSNLKKPIGVQNFSWDHAFVDRWQTEREEYLPIKLNEERLKRAEQIRLAMGIPLSAWFACFHIREGDSYGPTSGEKTRNVSVQGYTKGMRAVVESGGWVVRIGKPPLTPLSAISKVIDYANSSWRCELMDLYLISQCRYFIGCDSGPFFLAGMLFHKPVLVTNIVQWGGPYVSHRGDLAIPKHVYSKSRRRFLSLRELLEEPPEYMRWYHPPKNDYVYIDNTVEEIEGAVKEFLQNDPMAPLNTLQMEFNNRRRRQIENFLNTSDLDLIGKYYIASYLNVKSAICSSYLERNWLEDSMGSKPLPSSVLAAA